MTIFEGNPRGIVTVKFKSASAADSVRLLMMMITIQ